MLDNDGEIHIFTSFMWKLLQNTTLGFAKQDYELLLGVAEILKHLPLVATWDSVPWAQKPQHIEWPRVEL